MKAIVWHGKRDVRLDDIDEPGLIPAGWVRLAVGFCGICGTDIEEWRSGPHFVPTGKPHPLTGVMDRVVLGHEFSGKVIGVGEGVSEVRVGDRVAVDGLRGCGKCYWCKRHRVMLCPMLAAAGQMYDGGLEEEVNLPASVIFRIPKGVTMAQGALAETVAVGVRGVRRACVSPGDVVGVIGAGAVGLVTAQIAQLKGTAEVFVVDPLPSRRAVAQQVGLKGIADGELGEGRCDVVIECSGSRGGMREAIRLSRVGGRIVVIGISREEIGLDAFWLVSGEREIRGSLSHVGDEDFVGALSLLGSRQVVVDPIITDKVPLTRAIEDGFVELAEKPSEHVKILVEVGGEM